MHTYHININICICIAIRVFMYVLALYIMSKKTGNNPNLKKKTRIK